MNLYATPGKKSETIIEGVKFFYEKSGGASQARITDKSMAMEGEGENAKLIGKMGTLAFTTVKEALIGWEGLKDEDGNEVKFSKEAIDNLTCIMELFGAISDTKVTKVIEKNSEKSSDSA